MIQKYTTKVLIIGDPAVGKTELIWVGQGADFSSRPKRIIIGPDYLQLHFSDISIPGVDEHAEFSMQLWDIAGQARLGTAIRIYYREASGRYDHFRCKSLMQISSIAKRTLLEKRDWGKGNIARRKPNSSYASS